MRAEIIRNYKRLHHPTSFGGRSLVHRYYKNRGVKLKHVEDALSYVDSYTKHREAKRPRTYNPIFVRKKRELLQIDIMFLKDLAEDNDGFAMYITAIDSFSRYCWIQPVKSTSHIDVIPAFENILKRIGKVEKVLADRGVEFVSQQFKKLLNDRNIVLIHPRHRAATIERWHRTFKQILAKFLSENETRRYVDRLSTLMESYNQRYHRIIGMTPEQAEQEENFYEVGENLQKFYDKAIKKKRKPKFKVGQNVRVQMKQDFKFKRSYHQVFGDEVYKIKSIASKRLPIPMYKLTNFDGTVTMRDSYYENMLQPVKFENDVYRIQKVLKTKIRNGRKQHLVRWIGFGPEHDSWIDHTDITQVFNEANKNNK